ncbi:hypothetical protein V8C86DRAFT_1635646 [Haematococcus lacustris]
MHALKTRHMSQTKMVRVVAMLVRGTIGARYITVVAELRPAEGSKAHFYMPTFSCTWLAQATEYSDAAAMDAAQLEFRVAALIRATCAALNLGSCGADAVQLLLQLLGLPAAATPAADSSASGRAAADNSLLAEVRVCCIAVEELGASPNRLASCLFWSGFEPLAIALLSAHEVHEPHSPSLAAPGLPDLSLISAAPAPVALAALSA